MTSELDDLRKLAVDKATNSAALEDIEKAVLISKSIADERKSASELASADRSYRLTRLQSLLTGATIIISVLGLIATNVFNIAQLSTARDQVETTEWRDLLAAWEKTDRDVLPNPTIPFRLRSFSSSKRYSEDAKLIGAVVMAKMADPDGFRQLFNFIFAEGNSLDLRTMSEIDRQQNFSYKKLIEKCKERAKHVTFPAGLSEKSICWPGLTDKQVQEYGIMLEDTETWALRRQMAATLPQIEFISRKIADHLKQNTHGQRDTNLTDLYLLGADMSNADLSDLDISGSHFDVNAMNGARLRPKKYDNVWFQGTNWWQAGDVEPQFLRFLLANAYPRRGEHFFYFRRPQKREYVEDVLAICLKSQIDCPEEQIKFEDDATGIKD